jgi:hypothetical protein
MIRLELSGHLRSIAGIRGEVTLKIEGGERFPALD